MIRAGLTLAIAASVGVTATAATAAYRAGPPPAHTGAFSEPDCGECHFDAIRDDDRGAVRLDAPEAYEPGDSYTVTVAVRHPDLAAAGFQLSARFADGPSEGEQAGSLKPLDARTQVQHSGDGVAYASHTAAGTAPDRGAGTATWVIRWTAPDGGAGTVAFDVAAQTANDDDSEFGERIYLARHLTRSRPPCGSPGA